MIEDKELSTIATFRKKVRELKDELNCPVCIEILTKPTMLVECGHIFCKTCVETLESSLNSVQCPICRAPLKTKKHLAEIDSAMNKHREIITLLAPVEMIVEETQVVDVKIEHKLKELEDQLVAEKKKKS